MRDPDEATSELAYLSSHDLRGRLGTGELSSRHLVDVLLERVTAVDALASEAAVNSVAALDVTARDVADERDAERAKGISRGPLHGLPVLIKDNIEANGLPGIAGSTALVGRPTREAPLVARLREAGAIVIGSTNLSQWANIRSPRSTSGYSASGGLVANPWALDKSAGGSSSGSGAALAAGLAPLAVGTETDGSIVCPASLNGVVGLKPTVGNVPRQYVVPISASQDSPGPMGRDVEDVALLYGVLAASAAPEAMRTPSLAVATNWRTGHPQTDRAFDDAVVQLRSAGLSITERELAVPGEAEGNDELAVLVAELYDDLSAYLAERPGNGVRSLEDVVCYEDEHAAQEQAYFGHELFIAAVESKGRGGDAYAGARERNLAWAIETCLTPGLEGVDLVLAPAYGPAWKSDLVVGGHPGPASPATTAPAIAGWPIMSLPLAFVGDLPVGLAIIGRAQSEWLMIDAARRIERILRDGAPWRQPTWRLPTRG